MSTWADWAKSNANQTPANAPSRDDQLNAWGIQEFPADDRDESDQPGTTRRPKDPNKWSDEEDFGEDAASAQEEIFDDRFDFDQPPPVQPSVWSQFDRDLTAARQRNAGNWGNEGGNRDASSSWSSHNTGTVNSVSHVKQETWGDYSAEQQSTWNSGDRHGNQRQTSDWSNYTRDSQELNPSVKSEFSFRHSHAQNRPFREPASQSDFYGSTSSLPAVRPSPPVYGPPITLEYLGGLLQNPLMKTANIRENIFGGDPSGTMQTAMKRFRGVPEVDPAAEVRRLARLRNQTKPRVFIPMNKMARKTVSGRLPAKGERISQAARLREISPTEEGGPSVPASQPSRPRFVRQPSPSNVPIVKLGRPSHRQPEPEPSAVPTVTRSPVKSVVEDDVIDMEEETPSEPSVVDLDEEPIVEQIAEVTGQIDASDIIPKRISRLRTPRHCAFPSPDTGLVDLQSWHGMEGEPGSIPQTCFCSLSESVKSDGMQGMLSGTDLLVVERLISQGTCCATFRDNRRRLNRCTFPLEGKTQEDMLAQWLPQRGAFGFFCHDHAASLRSHKICPFCNEFYHSENKDFVVCRAVKGEVHLYHLDCQARMDMMQECPHCLADQRASIKEWYDGTDAVSFARNPRFSSDLFRDDEFREQRKIPLGRGRFIEYSGYISTDELAEMSQNPVEWTMENLAAALSALTLPILLAAKAQFPDLLKVVLDNSDSLLHAAARLGKVSAVLFLHKYGLPIDSVNSDKETPLIVAVKHSQVNVMYCLLEMGADVNKQDKMGRTACHWVAINQQYLILEHLHCAGTRSDITDNLGFAAVFYTLTWIREPDFDNLVNACIGLMHIDRDGWTLMHWVAFLHRIELVASFLDLNLAHVPDKWGDTPVHVAVRVGNIPFIKKILMVRPAIWVKAVNKEGLTPFTLAEKLSEEWRNLKLVQIARDIVSLMEGLMPADCVKSLTDHEDREFTFPRGEVCGDISRGRNIVPIPCYNFTNSQRYPHDLIYSNAVVRPMLFQPEPDLDEEARKPCGPSADCQRARCDCMRVPLCHRGRPCSDECKKNYGYHYVSEVIDDCYVPFPDPKTLKGQPIRVSGPGKQKPTWEEVSALQCRLLQRSVLQPALSVHLLHVFDLVESHWPRRGRPRRSRSFKRSRVPGRYLPSAVTEPKKGNNGNQQVPVYIRRLRSRSADRSRECRWMTPIDADIAFSTDDDFSSSHSVTTASSSAAACAPRHNEIDLFDEIERLDMGFLAYSAAVRFEREYPFERWNLQRLYEKGQRKKLSGIHGPVMDIQDTTILTGCSVKCQCGPACGNRVWQSPSLARLALVYVNSIVEWGVVALAQIARGQYLTEYSGELVNGNLYGNDTYLYEVRCNMAEAEAEEENKWVVDAKKVGNIGRFLNHSCRPNAKTVELHEHGMLVPRLCIIALRVIQAGESITLSYGDIWWQAKRDNEGIACHCGEPECRFSSIPKRLSDDSDDEDD